MKHTNPMTNKYKNYEITKQMETHNDKQRGEITITIQTADNTRITFIIYIKMKNTEEAKGTRRRGVPHNKKTRKLLGRMRTIHEQI